MAIVELDKMDFGALVSYYNECVGKANTEIATMVRNRIATKYKACDTSHQMKIISLIPQIKTILGIYENWQ